MNRLLFLTMLLAAATASAAEPFLTVQLFGDPLRQAGLTKLVTDETVLRPEPLVTELVRKPFGDRSLQTLRFHLDDQLQPQYDVTLDGPIDPAAFKRLVREFRLPTEFEQPAPNRAVTAGAKVASYPAPPGDGAAVAIGFTPPAVPPAVREGVKRMLTDYPQLRPVLESRHVRLVVRPKNPLVMAVTMTVIANEGQDLAAVRESVEGLRAVATLMTKLGAKQARNYPQFGLGEDDMARVVEGLEAGGVREVNRAVEWQFDWPRNLPYDLPLSAFAGNSERQLTLKQLGLAMHNYESANATFPMLGTVSKEGKPLLSWRVAVLPYIGEEELYREFKQDEPWDSEHNQKLIAKMPKLYAEPAGDEAIPEGTTHYQAFSGPNTALYSMKGKGASFSEMPDGTSNTILVAVAATPVEWTKPADIPFDPAGDPRELLYFRFGVTVVAFGDGSVRTAQYEIPADAWRNAINREDGKVLVFEPPAGK